MIEQYFKLGIRFKWNIPLSDTSGIKDGSIIDNPQRPPSHMFYDGLDGNLFSPVLQNVNAMGLTMRKSIPHSWLVYSAGHTTKMSATNDVLTGPMSGCIITVWKEKGKRYVGHVGTVDDGGVGVTINQKVKAKFADDMPQNTIGFNPALAWNPGEIMPLLRRVKQGAAIHITGLVTSNDQFYSILLFRLNGVNEWCVGGCKKVAPMDYQAIKAKFIPRGSLSDGVAFGGPKFIKAGKYTR